jgi:hypothetical protein
MVTTPLRLCAVMHVICALLVHLTLTAAQATDVIPSLSTATEPIDKVFRQYPGLKLILPLSDQPVYTSVRPLSSSTVGPLYGAFSVRQQKNIDAFLRAVNSLVDTRNRFAKAVGVEATWWWPTGIDRLKVDALLTQDLLTGRTDNPDEMTISTPRRLDGQLQVTVDETYTEHGQDRVLGQGHRTSLVTLFRQEGRWVIDEITTTSTDAYGKTSTETLTERLQEAVKPLDDAKHGIESLPQRLKIRKGAKPDH